MATRKVKDLAVVTGTYQSQGETKNRYQTVGAIMERDDGNQFIMLERWFNPAGVPNPENRSNLILSAFEPRDSNGQQQAPAQQRQAAPQQQRQAAPAPAAQSNNYDPDIPF